MLYCEGCKFVYRYPALRNEDLGFNFFVCRQHNIY
jgi:hypothetical protein